MKNLVVIYNQDDWSGSSPILSDSTREAFEVWHQRGQDVSINFFRAHIEWYDEATNTFEKAWMFRDHQWQKMTNSITPDLVFDKVAGKYDYLYFDIKMRMAQKVKVFNHPLFRTLLDNKLSQYLFFKAFMAPSFLAHNEDDLREAFLKIPGLKAVLKPLYGSGGKGILIEEKTLLLQKVSDFPLLVQEFVEAGGIPQFSAAGDLADLRLIYINHELIYAISRIAQSGSLFTNFHQGATAKMVPLDKIPENALLLASQIIEKLRVFPEANYALDFMFDQSEKPFLVEMNTTPGFDLLHVFGDEATNEKYFQAFTQLIP